MCDVIQYYEDRGVKKGIKKGFKEGFKKGFKKGVTLGSNITANNIIRSMTQKGFSLEEIADITNLPIERIRKVRKKMRRKQARALSPSVS